MGYATYREQNKNKFQVKNAGPGKETLEFPCPALPDQIDAPMTPRQLATLRTLSAVAYQPKLFERDLTAKEADRRIVALKAEIELANSF